MTEWRFPWGIRLLTYQRLGYGNLMSSRQTLALFHLPHHSTAANCYLQQLYLECRLFELAIAVM
jgi:hypothetical protein